MTLADDLRHLPTLAHQSADPPAGLDPSEYLAWLRATERDQ